jgi:hypothetical protein
MCEEESDDHEAIAKLFQINDSIHRTIERYKLMKKGDIEAANRIPKGTLGTSGAGVTKGADNSLNLIDFGDPEPAPSAGAESSGDAGPAQPAPKGNALEDDLLGLSLGGSTYGQTGGISLGGTNGSSEYNYKNVTISSKAASVLGLSGMAVPQQPQTQQSTLDILGGFSNSKPPSQVPSPAPSSFAQAPPPQAARSTPDPFAALSSPGPRQASPFQFQQSIKPQPTGGSSSGTADLLGGLGSPAPSSNLAQSSTAADDDEWTFDSAVPDTSKELTVVNSSVKIDFTISRESDTVLLIKSRISNNIPAPISELTFQSAVSKVCLEFRFLGAKLTQNQAYQQQMQPQSGVFLSPQQQNGITQQIRLNGVQRGQGGNVKMRWKLSYSVGGARKDEMGEITTLGVS